MFVNTFLCLLIKGGDILCIVYMCTACVFVLTKTVLIPFCCDSRNIRHHNLGCVVTWYLLFLSVTLLLFYGLISLLFGNETFDFPHIRFCFSLSSVFFIRKIYQALLKNEITTAFQTLLSPLIVPEGDR